MNASEHIAGVQAAFGHAADIAIIIGERVRNEENTANRPEDRAHLLRPDGYAFRGAEAAAAEQDGHVTISRIIITTSRPQGALKTQVVRILTQVCRRTRQEFGLSCNQRVGKSDGFDSTAA